MAHTQAKAGMFQVPMSDHVEETSLRQRKKSLENAVYHGLAWVGFVHSSATSKTPKKMTIWCGLFES